MLCLFRGLWKYLKSFTLCLPELLAKRKHRCGYLFSNCCGGVTDIFLHNASHMSKLVRISCLFSHQELFHIIWLCVFNTIMIWWCLPRGHSVKLWESVSLNTPDESTSVANNEKEYYRTLKTQYVCQWSYSFHLHCFFIVSL